MTRAALVMRSSSCRSSGCEERGRDVDDMVGAEFAIGRCGYTRRVCWRGGIFFCFLQQRHALMVMRVAQASSNVACGIRLSQAGSWRVGALFCRPGDYTLATTR